MPKQDNASKGPPADYLSSIENKCGASWKSIATSRTQADSKFGELEEALHREMPSDTAFIVFGSLARNEWTDGSDLDWALLVDGQADVSHLATLQRVRKLLDGLKFSKPGRTGVFGNLVFSHELIHRIGGDADSNTNTTRRILLFLESKSFGPGIELRERVLRQLLGRYVDDDHEYRPHAEQEPWVPGFLMNDVARFWRTMAVDFASKRREREGDKWALKRFKLRLSRKLIFTAGLSACLACKLKPTHLPPERGATDKERCDAIVAQLIGSANLSPLDALARMLIDFDAIEAGSEVFGAYDEFLQILLDGHLREKLSRLPAYPDPTTELFERTNNIAKQFQQGLSKLFFETDDKLTAATLRYGVF